MTLLSTYNTQVDTPTINVGVSTFIVLLALFPKNRGGREKVLPSPEPSPESLVASGFSRVKC